MYCACMCRVLLWMVIGYMVAPFLILSLLVVLLLRLELYALLIAIARSRVVGPTHI
jgi:hypothetical protein